MINNTWNIISGCAGHCCYDIHGNVKTLIQDNRKLATTGTYMGTGGSSSVVVTTERFKRLDYNYDLISGNVHSVSYQKGEADAWHHAYEYDADNRITNVYTSTAANTGTSLETVNNQGNIINDVMDNHLWDNDSRYEYYAHGALSRVELGDNQVQGNDYIYTLQGWIKGVNSNTLNTNNDPGQDGTGLSASNLNALFARDVYGYSLNYFTGDYQSIDASNHGANSFTASINGSDIETNRYDLFNGNIGSMITTITDAANPTAPITPTTPFTRAVLPLGNAYKYDQLNRLLQAVSYNNLDLNPSSVTYNQFGSGGSQMYYNSFEYDANGNIKKQQRADHTNTVFDDLEYKYAENASGKIQNRLYHVNEDPLLTALYTDDMEDQGTFDPTLATMNDNNNYGFDEIGNLIRDDKEGIDLITWRVDGKISEIKMSAASGKPNLKFEYNSNGLRIAKHKYNQSYGHIASEYYVHDASGNIIAVYENKIENSMATHKLVELDIYGAGKLGVVKPDIGMISATVDEQNYSRTLGKKTYFLSNHLGNNVTSITDMKIPIESTTTPGEVEYFIVQIESAVDYAAFGSELYNRKFSTSAMAYGFNGQRKDNEIYGDGNSYTAEFWQYDPRLGRRWNLDDKIDQSYSRYSVFRNNPNIFMDPNGDTTEYYDSESGDYLGTVNDDNPYSVAMIKKIDYDITYYQAQAAVVATAGFVSYETAFDYFVSDNIVAKVEWNTVNPVTTTHVSNVDAGDCLVATKETLGGTEELKGPNDPTTVHVHNGTTKKDASPLTIFNGVAVVDNSLDQGIPLAIGLDYNPGLEGANWDPTTDHWVAAVGKHHDSNGAYFYVDENVDDKSGVPYSDNPRVNKFYIRNNGKLSILGDTEYTKWDPSTPITKVNYIVPRSDFKMTTKK